MASGAKERPQFGHPIVNSRSLVIILQRIIQIILGILLAGFIFYWLVEGQVLNDSSSPAESSPQDTVPEAVPLSPASPNANSAEESPTPTPAPTPTPTPGIS